MPVNTQLESHLREAANILRSPVEAADFKTYVFPLFFFNRISDVYDGEHAAALAELGGDDEYAQFPQNYRLQISKSCYWGDVRVVTTKVGQTLQKSMRTIEKANLETLYGILRPGLIRIVCLIRCSATSLNPPRASRSATRRHRWTSSASRANT